MESSRGANINWVIDKIIDSGDPIIIATDVSPAPGYVKKLSSIFSSKLFVPKRDLSVRFKDEITKTLEFSNDHEMDAAAAALNALSHYKQLFDKVDEKVLPSLSDEVKAGLVLGKYSSIDDALKSMFSFTEEPRKAKRRSETDVSHLLKRIDELKKMLVRERTKINELSRMISALRKRKCRTIVDKQITEENKHLREVIEKLRAVPQNFVRVVEIENYGKEEVIKKDISGKVIMVKQNKGNPKYLRGAKLIIANFPIDIDVPVVSSDNVNLINLQNNVYVRKEEVEKILKYHSGFLRWIKKYKMRFHEK